MNKGLLLLLALISISCSEFKPEPVEVIKREQMVDLLSLESDKVQVINFWATWCKPCVDELPDFQKIATAYSEEIEMSLISLDDVEKVNGEVQLFVNTMGLTPSVYLLDDPYANEWIPLVDKHWDGVIPVTLIYSKDDRRFYSKSFTYEELETEIKKFL